MPSWLCKIWRFMANIFGKIVDFIVDVIRKIVGLVVDALDSVLDSVFGGSGLTWLLIGAVAFFILTRDKEEEGATVEESNTQLPSKDEYRGAYGF